MTRSGWTHSKETKAKIAASHRAHLSEPEYREARRQSAKIASECARLKFLRTLAETGLVLADLPIAKGDAARLRRLPCAICRTADEPRELAHIRARSDGGPMRHAWGNSVPLCRGCHERIDHRGVAGALDITLA